MTTVTIPPLDQRAVERFNQRQGNFYKQTVQQNQDRLDAKPLNLQNLLDEIKFIESELISQYGDPI